MRAQPCSEDAYAIANTSRRIRKYTTPPSETAASPRPTQRGPESPGVSMQQQHRVNGSEASGAVPSSPAARGPALPSPHLTPGMEGQVFPSGAPLLDSPLDLSAPTEGFRELQISGSEPRLWPGMISRRHRVDSLRQSSVQDAEGPVSATSPPRRRQTNDSDRRD